MCDTLSLLVTYRNMSITILLFIICMERFCTCCWTNGLRNFCSWVTSGSLGTEDATEEYVYIDYTKEPMNCKENVIESAIPLVEKEDVALRSRKGLRPEFTPVGKESVTLDFAQIDLSKIDVFIHDGEYANNTTYYPKFGFFTIIRDGKNDIMPYKSAICSMAQMYSDENVTLLNLFIRINEEYESKYFEKRGSKWGPITGMEFYAKSDLMKDSRHTTDTNSEMDKEKPKHADSLKQERTNMNGNLRG